MRTGQLSPDDFNSLRDAVRMANETGRALVLDENVLRNFLGHGWEARPTPVMLAGDPPTLVIPPKTLVVMTSDGVSAFGLHQVAPLRRLHAVAVFIPKSLREPFLGDLREDLADMAASGRSVTAMWWVAISQIVLLVLRCVISRVAGR